MTAPALTASLGSFVFDGVTEDDDGLVWTVTGIDGWYDSAPVRSSLQERQPVGESISAARINSRPIVLKLDATVPNPDSVPDRIADLAFNAHETAKAAARCVMVPRRLTVTDPLRATQAMVRRLGPIKVAWLGRLVVLQVQIPLTAEDPRRYETTEESDDITIVGSDDDQSEHVIVGGTVNTPFRAVLNGPAINPRLLSHSLGTVTSRPFFQWTGDLNDSSEHLIVDTRTGLIEANGVPVALEPGSQLFELVAGDNFLTYSRGGRTGDAVATISRANAYD